MRGPSEVQRELWRERLRRVRSRAPSLLLFGAGIVATLVALLIYRLLLPPPHQLTSREVNDAVAHAMASATPAPTFSSRVYQVIQPSLVLIQTEGQGANGNAEHGLGSGVIIDDRGDILTSLHVVTQTNTVQVTFADGTQSSAQVTVRQPEHDIAVLRAAHPPAQLVPAVMGNPGAVHVGDEALVVGNPLGLYSSMSAGVISGLNRSFRPPNGAQTLKGMMQIDAAVNPGNSGGPLLNRDGQVIGIVTGLANPAEQDAFAGIGFAVPIDVAGAAAGSPPD